MAEDELDLQLVKETLETIRKTEPTLSLVELKTHLGVLKKQEKLIKEKLKNDKPPPNVEEYLRNLLIEVDEGTVDLEEKISKTPDSPAPDLNASHRLEEERKRLEEEIKRLEDERLKNNVGPPEIDPKEIEYNEQKDFLGQGSFGQVYKGRCRGQQVAVKVPIKQDLTDKELEEFRNEVGVMKRIFHPHCVLFLGATTQKNNLKIVTELLNTDMEKLLKGNRPLTLYQRINMLKDSALGINWLHGILNIIHHDLKPANLLVDSNLRVKITDFGFSQLKASVDDLESNGVARGTPLWMSPEILTGKKFNEKCDVYSFGLIIWQVLTRKEPFTEHSDFRKFRIAVVRKNERPPIPKDAPSILKKN